MNPQDLLSQAADLLAQADALAAQALFGDLFASAPDQIQALRDQAAQLKAQAQALASQTALDDLFSSLFASLFSLFSPFLLSPLSSLLSSFLGPHVRVNNGCSNVKGSEWDPNVKEIQGETIRSTYYAVLTFVS